MTARIDRRSASARPIAGFCLSSPKARVVIGRSFQCQAAPGRRGSPFFSFMLQRSNLALRHSELIEEERPQEGHRLFAFLTVPESAHIRFALPQRDRITCIRIGLVPSAAIRPQMIRIYMPVSSFVRRDSQSVPALAEALKTKRRKQRAGTTSDLSGSFVRLYLHSQTLPQHPGQSWPRLSRYR